MKIIFTHACYTYYIIIVTKTLIQIIKLKIDKT